MLPTFVEDARVDLIAEDDDIGPLLESRNETLDLIARVDAAGGIRGAIEDDQAGAFVDLREHLFWIEGEAARLM